MTSFIVSTTTSSPFHPGLSVGSGPQESSWKNEPSKPINRGPKKFLD